MTNTQSRRSPKPGAPRFVFGAFLALAAGLAAPLPASAAESLFLTWDDCPLGAAASNKSFACDVNDPVFDLVCSFGVPADLNSVIGVEAVVDLQSAAATTPDWWHIEQFGCRAGLLDADPTFTGLTACLDPWSGLAGAEIQGIEFGQPRGLPSQMRLKVVAGVLKANATTLLASGTYYAVRLRLSGDLSAGPGRCLGCIQPVCLVLNGITVRRLPGAPGGDLLLTAPGPSNANQATWQGGAGADCSAVPVRAVTWGRVKALYR